MTKSHNLYNIAHRAQISAPVPNAAQNYSMLSGAAHLPRGSVSAYVKTYPQGLVAVSQP